MHSIDPCTGKKIASYPETPASRVEDILKRGARSLAFWRRLSFEQRAAPMKKAAAILRKNKESYARLMAAEMGKPLAQGRGEIEKCAAACDYYAERAQDFLTPTPVKTEASQSFISYEPLGLVLAVMPWNFPFWQVFRCAAPALMAGNGIILKHAFNVCGCALAIEKIFKEAGFPSLLFANVFVPVEKVKDLITHPLIAAVSLTGSTRAGQSVGAAAGAAIKKVVLELGGSDPYLILEDADLELAAETCVNSRLINAGQSCIAAKRFIVAASIYKEFERRFVAKMQSKRLGAPLDEGVDIGPLARHDLRDNLHEQVRRSLKQGAKLLLGGQLPEGPGAFYPPTVLSGVHSGMTCYGEELFGPVASLIKVTDKEQAIRVANDTVFGLGSAVFTRSVKRGLEVARRLEAGCCFVNDYVRSDPRLPFGGIKQSGYGRELAEPGIKEFVNAKTIYVR